MLTNKREGQAVSWTLLRLQSERVRQVLHDGVEPDWCRKVEEHVYISRCMRSMRSSGLAKGLAPLLLVRVVDGDGHRASKQTFDEHCLLPRDASQVAQQMHMQPLFDVTGP